MDSRTACNFLCVLLCSVGVVVFAQDRCATLGNVSEIYRDCIAQNNVTYAAFKELNLTSQLGHLCGSEQSIRQCFWNMTANCSISNKLVMAKPLHEAFFLCNIGSHEASQWAKDNLNEHRHRERCAPDFRQPPDCKKDVDKLFLLWPFQNQPVLNGTSSLALTKRTFFGCWKSWLQDSNCTETTWRYTYITTVISAFENARYFGFNFNDWDKKAFVEVQAGLDQVQNSQSVRDIFGMFS